MIPQSQISKLSIGKSTHEAIFMLPYTLHSIRDNTKCNGKKVFS